MKYDGLRFRVQARLAGKPFADPFGVDVAFAEPIAEPADEIVGRDLLAFAGVPTPRFRLYPRTTHLAEKLHALTLPRKTPSSRVKDLPDIALLALAGPVDGAPLRTAIERTFAHRATHAVPTTLPAAPPSWAPVYERMARNDELRWRSLEEIERVARAFLEPVLAAAAPGTWDPEEWRWRS